MKKTEAISGDRNVLHVNITNEELAAKAFTAQSILFDEQYSGDTIIQYKRKRVRDHVGGLLSLGSSILELNAGTGEDAIYFAHSGYRVHATDISPGMINVIKRKVRVAALDHLISFEECSFTNLEDLKNRGPFDMIFSNFAGLNCTAHLDEVLQQLPLIVKPGGLVTLVLLPKFCLWEFLLLLKGKWKTAFRRFFSGNGALSHVEGNYFRCWYYNPSDISRALHDRFDMVKIEGLCTLVPPSYILNFAEKHPKSYAFLVKWENRLKSKWPWKVIGDYYIVTFRKKIL